MGVIIGIAVAGVLLIAGVGGGIYYWKRRQRTDLPKTG